ncbi:MAG: hypothetical protein ACAH17_03515 [Candidatus Paceibacterota bacterium]
MPLQKSADGIVRIDRVNNVAGMLDRALNIIDEQLTKIALKSRQAGGLLDANETKSLHGHVKALVELSKEEREREKADKTAEQLASLSNDELLELAKAQLESVKPK